ncbi:MAG: hypothetical protein ACRDSE_23240 [Pseudonocardiaceae bacterium]
MSEAGHPNLPTMLASGHNWVRPDAAHSGRARSPSAGRYTGIPSAGDALAHGVAMYAAFALEALR